MKIGDVKSEALKLMFVNLDRFIDAESLSDLMYDETYASYLVNMDGAIVRALNRMALAHKLGTKSVVLSGCSERGEYAEYDLSLSAPDMLRVRSVLHQKNGRLEERNDWKMIGRSLILPRLCEPSDRYELVYYPKAPNIELNHTDELPIEEEAAQIIPYYIKGELFEDDEPNAAAQARNLFEQWLSDLPDQENDQNNIQILF